MDYRGTFQDGVIRPDQPVNLPEGTPVEFRPLTRNGPPPGGAADALSDDEVRAMQDRYGKGRSLDELVAESGARPVRSADDFRVPGVTDADIEALEAIIRERRAR